MTNTDNITIQFDHIITIDKNSIWVEIENIEYCFGRNICKINAREKTATIPEWLCIKEGLEAYIQ